MAHGVKIHIFSRGHTLDRAHFLSSGPESGQPNWRRDRLGEFGKFKVTDTCPSYLPRWAIVQSLCSRRRCRPE